MTITSQNMKCSDIVTVTGAILFKTVLFTFLHNMFGLLPIYDDELQISTNKFLFNKIRCVKCATPQDCAAWFTCTVALALLTALNLPDITSKFQTIAMFLIFYTQEKQSNGICKFILTIPMFTCLAQMVYQLLS